MNIIKNAPRRSGNNNRRDAARRVRSGSAKLYLLGPKQHGGTGWRYAAAVGQSLVLIGKAVATRDSGRSDATRRYGCKAGDYRPARNTSRRLAA